MLFNRHENNHLILFLKTYGYEHLLTLMNLEKTGLLCPHGNRTYAVIRKSLRLIVEEVNEQVCVNSHMRKTLL